MIQNPLQFNQKDPRESVILTFDATAMLPSGVTLSSAGTPSITTTVGNDASPALVLTGTLVNSSPLTVAGRTIAAGCAVQAVASAGDFSSQYLIAITCPTSNQNIVLTLKAVLPMAAQ